jgi:hypothetical protein
MRAQILGLGLTLVAATTAFPSPAVAKWPPWISIETPVNPFDPSARGAVMLVRCHVREGTVKLSDVTATAEGIENGHRRSIKLRFDTTPVPGVFALRRQWPEQGEWLIRVALDRTTAIVTLGADGNVAGIRVPTEMIQGQPIPRAVSAREIDSTLALAGH